MWFSGISPKQTNSSHYIATLIKLKAQVSRFRTNPTFYLQHDNTPHCTPAWSQWFILHILAGLSEHAPNILFGFGTFWLFGPMKMNYMNNIFLMTMVTVDIKNEDCLHWWIFLCAAFCLLIVKMHCQSQWLCEQKVL